MRKLLIIFVIIILAGTAAYGEEAALVPEGNLRLSFIQNPGFAGKDLLVNWKLGAEYATADWLNLQLLWNPRLRPDLCSGSLYFGIKNYIMGDGALVPVAAQWLRLSAALGILIPPPDPQPTLRDQDQMLWGSALRLYSDFLINRYFYINLFFEGDFYPPQRADSDVFQGELVRHYLDLTGELELNFETPLANGIVLKYGAPVRFFYAPYMNASDEYAGSQYCLSTGAYVGLKPPEGEPPMEIYFRYNAHLLGQNMKQAHYISFILRVTLPPDALKLRAKDKDKEGTL